MTRYIPGTGSFLGKFFSINFIRFAEWFYLKFISDPELPGSGLSLILLKVSDPTGSRSGSTTMRKIQKKSYTVHSVADRNPGWKKFRSEIRDEHS
jgi:hypothetical protein